MVLSLLLLFVQVSTAILNQQYWINLSLTTENGPYYINHDIIIHETLFIEDGTNIIFNSSSTLEIVGALVACNNIINPIQISAVDNTINPAINIRADLGANAIFCNTKFQSMQTAINIGCSSTQKCGNKSGTIQFYNTRFENITSAITLSDNRSTKQTETTNIEIYNSTFNKTNIIITQPFSPQTVYNINTQFKNCVFLNFDHILNNYNQKITFVDSYIIGDRKQTCLRGGNGILSNVTISNCNIAIQMSSMFKSGYDILYSNIKDNNIGVVTTSHSNGIWSGAHSRIYGTNFINNEINIQHTSVTDRLYEYNFWGTYDENIIVTKIMDVCDDKYQYNSTKGYGLIIWWPYISSTIENHNNSFIESTSTDITEHSLNYCTRHILPSVYSSDDRNISLLLQDSPFYIVSDTIICNDLYINSGSSLIFTADYVLFVFGGIHTCVSDNHDMSVFNGQNYGIPNDKTHRGSMVIDVSGGIDASVCYVEFTGMKAGLVMTSGGNSVSISHCAFNNLQSAISSYSDTTIIDTVHRICASTDNVTTLMPDISTTTLTTIATNITDVSSTFSIDTTTTAVMINPSVSVNDGSDDTDTDSDDYCNGVSDDIFDFFIIKGECISCEVPLNHGIINACLKKAYYNYYSNKYDIVWDLNDMVCDELFVVNIDNENMQDDGKNNGFKMNTDNGYNALCGEKYDIKFKLDVVFDNDLIAQNQFDKISLDTDNNILLREIEDSVGRFMVSCEPEFKAIDCDITAIVSNIPRNTSNANLISCIFSLIFFIVLVNFIV